MVKENAKEYGTYQKTLKNAFHVILDWFYDTKKEMMKIKTV